MFDLAGTDTEREGPEGAVCCGMAVTTDHSHTGLRKPLFGPNHVDNALLLAVRPIERDAELAAVLFELHNLSLGDFVDDGK